MPTSRFYHWSGKPGELRACSRSKYRAAAEVWPLPPRARLGLLIPRQGCGRATHRETALQAPCLLEHVPWGFRVRVQCPGEGSPGGPLALRSEESFLELNMGAAVTSSAPPFGTWDRHLPGTLLTLGWVDFLMGCERCFYSSSHGDEVFSRA